MVASISCEVVSLSIVVVGAGVSVGDRHPDAAVRMMRHMRIVVYLFMVVTPQGILLADG